MNLAPLLAQQSLIEDMCKHEVKPWIARIGFDPEMLKIIPSWAQLDPTHDREVLEEMKTGQRPIDYVMMFDGVKVLDINSASNPMMTVYHFKQSFGILAKQMAFLTDDLKTLVEQRKKDRLAREAIEKTNLSPEAKGYLYKKVTNLRKEKHA